MKNFIFIDVDTDREKPIIFGKPPDITPPETQEDAKAMILNDIACLAEAISTLILMAEQNNYAEKDKLALATVSTIYELLQYQKNIEDEPKKES